MAFKDTINKVVSYFDTDDVSEVEEDVPVQQVEEQQSQRPHQTARQSSQQQIVNKTNQPSNRPVQPSRNYKAEQQPLPNYQSQVHSNLSDTSERRQTQYGSGSHVKKQDILSEGSRVEQTRIALKYPKKYEDAQEIVDLLIENECVLIDFQYMLDAQARRCLDFIDGASKVLYGSLQKVGSSMYLLTPSNVSVNIEDMNIPNTNQDFGYDFDMKRR
ncbi:cell division protein SepF [Streptococcus porcinus]